MPGRLRIHPIGYFNSPAYRRPYYEKNQEKFKQRLSDQNRKRRMIVLSFYGGNPPTCACCGEGTMQFLSIDHIQGGGNKHRKELGVGKSIYPWLIRNNFPDGFQVLCHNCNMAKGFYGRCPHSDCKLELDVL